MSWLAISDGRSCLRRPSNTAPELLATGTLVLEAQTHGDRDATVDLLTMECRDGWPRSLRVSLSPDGRVTVEHRQGRSAARATVHAPRLMANDTLRLTYGWDAPARRGTLTAENVDSAAAQQVAVAAPHPMPTADLRLLAEAGCGSRIDPRVSLLAASNRLEPIGPMPGFARDTLIETAAGTRRIETIRPGDLVVTAGRGLQPVRHVVSRAVPAVGQYRPVRLRAPFLGLRTDMCVAPHHRVMIDGSDAEYLFGTDTVMVEARHLQPMAAPTAATGAETAQGPVVRYHQLVLDMHDCLYTAGTWSESLYIGRLARRPVRLASSVLAGVAPARLPVHAEVAGPLLKPFEAMVLVSGRCA
ncbi:Hint domain-containing protein [Psychromarinibacter halotolerans]|uniref:Hint domain-containing protein n=1 Tax=Psychromarinibacter halotolerans TaxID=1775175 RepID=A0ABV7GVM6_9RHOB|nr:Hint domain-containing protein [Psychromarinibacter halotolerans]MDF0596452.1 Hint domain-containing protein [Psychromarinibacter halotolerans]